MKSELINEKGFWETNDLTGHYSDVKLLIELRKLIKKEEIKTLVDFGCGPAFYVDNLSDLVEFEAYDGNPNTPEITKGIAKVLDLSQSFDLKKKFDCVLSLEVGEHIPKQYEEIFIDNLIRHSRNKIILSWAVEGQAGDGHINCRNNDYIIEKFKEKGFQLNEEYTKQIREKDVVWFKYTIFVFDKAI